MYFEKIRVEKPHYNNNNKTKEILLKLFLQLQKKFTNFTTKFLKEKRKILIFLLVSQRLLEKI
jgi:hypothetical protein